MELPLSACSSVKTPMARQMASAVSLLSPVMTTTRMPAAWQSSIAERTCGGSRRRWVGDRPGVHQQQGRAH